LELLSVYGVQEELIRNTCRSQRDSESFISGPVPGGFEAALIALLVKRFMLLKDGACASNYCRICHARTLAERVETRCKLKLTLRGLSASCRFMSQRADLQNGLKT
jgi:hypothetical protein